MLSLGTGLLFHAVLSMLARMVAAHRALFVPLRDQWRALRPVLWGSIPAWAAARTVAEATGSVPAALSLSASLLAGIAAYAVVVSLVDPGVIPRSASQLRRILRAAPAS